MEFDKSLPLVEGIFRDLKAFKLQVKTKVFKISECNQIRQGINHMRTDYDHWLAILRGIRDKLNAELDVWERALTMIDSMLEEDKLKVEISDGGYEMYIKLTRELKDTLFVNVDLKEGLENVPLPKAKVWIEKKIMEIRNSLKTMEQDRKYIEEQKSHIFVLEKCMEEKLKKIQQNRVGKKEPIEHIGVVAKGIYAREIQIIQSGSESQKAESIELELDNKSEYKIVENVEVDTKNITKIKSSISHKDSSTKTYGKVSEINDLPEEINYLFVKFPNLNKTENSESRGNQEGDTNQCKDEPILQDREPKENQTVEKFPCEDEAILREHNSIEEKVINREVNVLQEETIELLVEFPNSNNTKNREPKGNQGIEKNPCEDEPILQDREPKENQTVEKFPCEDEAILREHNSIEEKVINNREVSVLQEKTIELLVEFPNSNKTESREPKGNQGVERNPCEDEPILQYREPVSKGNQGAENPCEDELILRDSTEEKVINNSDINVLQDEQIKLLVGFPNYNQTENREPKENQGLEKIQCKDEPILQDREPESKGNQGAKNPCEDKPELGYRNIIEKNTINNSKINDLRKEIKDIFLKFPSCKITEYGALKRNQEVDKNPCKDEPILQDRKPKENQTIEKNPGEDEAILRDHNSIEEKVINSEVNVLQKETIELLVGFSNSNKTENGEILQDRKPESKGNQGVKNPYEDKPELGYRNIIEKNTINNSKINDLRREIKDIFLKFPSYKTTEYGALKRNQEVDKNKCKVEPILQDREPESKGNKRVYNRCEDRPKLGYGNVIENKIINDSKLNDIRTEIKDLLSKFPSYKQTEYSTPKKNLGEGNNSCEDKFTLQDRNTIKKKIKNEIKGLLGKFPNSVKAENCDHKGYQEEFLNPKVINVSVAHETLNETFDETLYETLNETINDTINETFNKTGNETVYYDAEECQDPDSGEDADFNKSITALKNVYISS